MPTRRHTRTLTQNAIERMDIPGIRVVKGELAMFRSHLEEVGREEMALARSGFRSDFFTICLVRSGTVAGLLDHEAFQLVQGDLALAPPHRIKQMTATRTDSEVLAICFTVEFLKRVKLRRLADQMAIFSTGVLPVLHLDPSQMELLEASLQRVEQRIDAAYTHTYGMDLVVNAFVELLLETGHIGRCNGQVQRAPMGRREELVGGFVKLVQEHHLAQRNLSFYSDRLFVTTKHLSETVKEVTGRTAGQILDDLLLVEARRLLDETALSISEVAFQLQFADPSQFSKFFHRMTGMPPRMYRRAVPVNRVAHMP